ncbi:unnamed protein product [Symbiodinium microadriaticum]|nr:unnamed protein product [Symbiodinium microadriaticum]
MPNSPIKEAPPAEAAARPPVSPAAPGAEAFKQQGDLQRTPSQSDGTQLLGGQPPKPNAASQPSATAPAAKRSIVTVTRLNAPQTITRVPSPSMSSYQR